jgi:hypothetical protein
MRSAGPESLTGREVSAVTTSLGEVMKALLDMRPGTIFAGAEIAK